MVYSYGVGGAEYGDCAAEFNAFGYCCRCCEDDFGRGDGIVGSMVFADAEEVEAGLVHEDDFFDDFLEALVGGLDFAGGGDVEVAEHADAELHNDGFNLSRKLPLRCSDKDR